MKIIPSIPGVLQLEFPTRLDLTLSCCRMQEFFESPYPFIRGKVFSLEAFVATYYADIDGTDYFRYWEGFNVPAAVVNDFFAKFTELTKREELVQHVWQMGDYKYLIAADVTSDPTTVEHELAHARYALNIPYQINAQRVLLDVPTAAYDSMFADLVNCGYPDDDAVLIDELHAYLGTSTDEELLDTFPSVPLATYADVRERLRGLLCAS